MTPTHAADDARREVVDEMREIASQLSAVGDRSAARVVHKIIDSIEALRRGTQPPLAPAFPSGDHLPARENAIKRLGKIVSRLEAEGDYDAAELVYDPLARGV